MANKNSSAAKVLFAFHFDLLFSSLRFAIYEKTETHNNLFGCSKDGWSVLFTLYVYDSTCAICSNLNYGICGCMFLCVFVCVCFCCDLFAFLLQLHTALFHNVNSLVHNIWFGFYSLRFQRLLLMNANCDFIRIHRNTENEWARETDLNWLLSNSFFLVCRLLI